MYSGIILRLLPLTFLTGEALVFLSTFNCRSRCSYEVYTSLPNDSTEHVSSETGKFYLNRQLNVAKKIFSSGLAFSLSQSVQLDTASASTSNINLPSLPYAYTALEPYISARTLQYHHDKHHAKYVATTKSMVANTELEYADLITIMRRSHGTNPALFNNAAQCWNHAFYWKCMRPYGGGLPTGKLRVKIEETFGSVKEFRNQFAIQGNTNFGSGWTWLVKTADDKLEIVKTSAAENPLVMDGKTPILTMDVWEHAYYLDYQNERNRYVDAFLDKLVNWRFVSEQYASEKPISL